MTPATAGATHVPPTETLHERMSRLARDLQSEGSSQTTLRHVVTAAVSMVGPCESAGISVATRNGRITTCAASDSVPDRGDLLQMELGEGPCTDAAWHELVVQATDLSVEPRWPRWAPRATQELGVRSMLCLRLFTHEDRLGALNLYSSRAHAFTPADVEEGVALAAHAAVAVVAAEEIEGLQTALSSRTTIAQATGMVMATYQLDSSTAFGVLVRISSEENRKLASIAADLVMQHDVDPAHGVALSSTSEH
jgi:GAF domain-containing protein